MVSLCDASTWGFEKQTKVKCPVEGTKGRSSTWGRGRAGKKILSQGGGMHSDEVLI